MPLQLLTIPIVAQLAAPAAPGSPGTAALVAAAAASPRPRQCVPTRAPGDHLWAGARRPELRRYCLLLARGYAALRRAPAEARKAAEIAERHVPGRAATAVLRARAEVALGRAAEAWKLFEEALKADRRSVETPGALHDLAVAAHLSGHVEDAIDAYRALVPRAGLIAGRSRRQRIYLEAAVLVSSRDAASLDEAVGYLREARRLGSSPGLTAYVLAALALTLDRQGRTEEARGVAAEAGGPWRLTSVLDGDGGDGWRPVLPTGTLPAMIAILAEREDRRLAEEQWNAFLAGEGSRGPWAEHARKKLSALGHGPKR